MALVEFCVFSDYFKDQLPSMSLRQGHKPLKRGIDMPHFHWPFFPSHSAPADNLAARQAALDPPGTELLPAISPTVKDRLTSPQSRARAHDVANLPV